MALTCFSTYSNGAFEQGRLWHGHPNTEVDYPSIAGPRRYVLAICSWANDYAIVSTIGVGLIDQFVRNLCRNVERPSLGISHKGDTKVLIQADCSG